MSVYIRSGLRPECIIKSIMVARVRCAWLNQQLAPAAEAVDAAEAVVLCSVCVSHNERLDGNCARIQSDTQASVNTAGWNNILPTAIF